MTNRMNVIPSDSTEVPEVAEEPRTPETVSVVAAVTVVAGVDPQATLDAVGAQDHAPSAIRLIGADVADSPAGVVLSEDLEEVVAGLDPSVEYVWILHGDAQPRPDALRALVSEAERFEASLAGSKLLFAGTADALESVGSATDVFGEPYSGLDEGEVDLEQYDVVRDVAFVSSVSMLVRRDLLRGLRGLDSALAPVAAGLDLSQRVRIAGGRVIVVPSSEVFHQRRCGRGDGGWREQSGRMRAMLKAYRPITLLWMVPFAFFTGVLDTLAGLLQGRWRLGPRYLLTWAWNLARLPSTIALRRNIARVRQVGDEELFRYQVRGSVRLRQVGSELSDRVLRIFDEDSPVARRATEVWNSAATWGVMGALLVVVVGLRSIFLGGLPVVGYSLPFDEPVASLQRFVGGWNAAGLGSSGAVHPSVVPAAVFQWLTLGNAELARSLLTLAAFVAGVFGIGRLASRLGIGGPGGYLGGVAALFGFPAAVLAGDGRWAALVGIGLLPWALIAVTGGRPPGRRGLMGTTGLGAATVGLVAFFVPLLAPVPFLFAVALKAMGRFQSRPIVALVATAGGLVAVPFLMSRLPDLGGAPFAVPARAVPIVILAVTLLLAMVAGSWRTGFLAAVMALGGIAVARVAGPDLQEAVLAVGAIGVGLAVAAALRPRERRGPVGWVAVAGGVALLMVSLTGASGGAGGMPGDVWGDSLEFVGLGAEGVERALLVAPDPGRLPGDSRPGPGFWYRLVDSRGPTLDQAVLGPMGEGDVALDAALDHILTGATLEPGELLRPFAIRWIVVVDEASNVLTPVLSAQVDLNPFPFAEGLQVYDNVVNRPVASAEDGTVWRREGTGFSGPPVDGRVRLAIQGGSGWEPDWQPQEWAGTVDGSTGEASYQPFSTEGLLGLAGAAVVVLGLVVGIWERRSRR